ncbi:MAG: type II toxin-antitoxin system HipA family toxin [Gammaproteobacteria bacterium]|nr:MAG: type II toxin-antitoxin system HipA family toxin [Gammaproteobacteria bacterium]
MQNLAEVRLWGRLVGALAYDPRSKIGTFEYAPEWIKSGVEIAPLQMPLSSQKYQFPSLNSETYKGLPAVFADTLPDDFGNAVINAWLARQGRDSDDFTALERLLYTGNRGMGAIEYAPAIDQSSVVEHLEIAALVEMAQQVLDQRESVNTRINQNNNDAMQALFQIGTSAGGARAKAVIAVNQDRTAFRSGQVDAPQGFEHYLLKFDGVEEHKINSQTFGDPQGFGRMEYAYYLMAVDAGINISPSELLIEGKRAHFITKRFDRDGNRKRHVVSLCAMDHADYKKAGSYSYEQLLAVARQLKLPRKDAIEIYRRMVFNIVARNHDDHTKNTSFILDSANSQWRLSPAFDLAYSYKKESPWVNAHQMSLNGKRDNFIREDLLTVGMLIGNFKKEAKQIIEEITDVVSQWNRYAKKAEVFKPLANEIKQNHRLTL